MKNTKMNLIIAAMAVTMMLAGCGQSTDSSSSTGTASSVTSGQSLISQATDNDSSEESSVSESTAATTTTTAATTKAEAEEVPAENASDEKDDDSESDDGLFSKRDLKQTADLTDAVEITAEDGKTLEITEAGVYVVSGSAENFTIRVEADDEAKVQIVLNGVDITNSDFPAIYVVNADKVFVTTVSGTENNLSVTGEFTADGDTNTDAVIFSKDDIVLNGEGTLNINSTYGNGISGHDDMKITGGTYTISCALDAFEANDSILINDGTFTIYTSKDGLHCANDEDSTVGYIYIAGGSFTIQAGSDGIQGATFVQIDGGTFDITSSEGIEATQIQINGGTINISASDDGLNASSKVSGLDVFVEITGGELNITMSGGDVDCIDANGSVTISGGTINLTFPEQGPSESFDYDGNATYTGGTIIINGTQVDSIPQPAMMGGGGMGGFGGDMGGGFGGGPGGHGGRDMQI